MRSRHFDRGFHAAQRFAVLRNLRGHGYEGDEQCLEAVRLLAFGKVFTLARAEPECLPAVAALLARLEHGIEVWMPKNDSWGRTDPAERARALALLRGGDANDAHVVPTVHREWREHQRGGTTRASALDAGRTGRARSRRSQRHPEP